MTTPQPAALPEQVWLMYAKKKPGLRRLSFVNDLSSQEKASGWVSEPYALAHLESQPAAPLRLDQIDLEPLKAELSDPAKAKAFLQKHGFLNASGELAEQYGGKPEQPAAAGVSDAEIVGAIIESGGSALEGLPSNWDAGDIAVSPAQLVSGVRAILALRPQSESEQEKELRRSLAEAQATISERNAEIIELQKRLRRSPQAVPMTGDVEVARYSEWRRGDLLRITSEGNSIGPFSVGQIVRHDDEDGDNVPYCRSLDGDYRYALIHDQLEFVSREAHHGITAQGAQGGEAK